MHGVDERELERKGVREAQKKMKMEDESFSDVVIRLTEQKSLMRFAGILTEQEANALEKSIQESRQKSRERSKRIEKELHDT